MLEAYKTSDAACLRGKTIAFPRVFYLNDCILTQGARAKSEISERALFSCRVQRAGPKKIAEFGHFN